ncbi:HMG-Y-related protein A-like [Bidens hawaiensis]|uniref:HMG-Y-related protein A-like n=1 Tax=Bidens hawaiensis TaxID=980011 RepID=UPI00404A8D78
MQMIFAAIDLLKEKDGSSESSISNYIESTYVKKHGPNPLRILYRRITTTFLADQLKKPIDHDKLVVLNNNYSRPEFIIPAKHGRGCPPKAKDLAWDEGWSSEVSDGA